MIRLFRKSQKHVKFYNCLTSYLGEWLYAVIISAQGGKIKIVPDRYISVVPSSSISVN